MNFTIFSVSLLWMVSGLFWFFLAWPTVFTPWQYRVFYCAVLVFALTTCAGAGLIFYSIFGGF